MASRRLRRARVASAQLVKIHDRRATETAENLHLGTITVDDPYGSAFDKIVVFRNLRDDPLAALHNSNQVDEAQFRAGRHWQKCYELSELGGARAIDPTKEAVDGGRMPEPLSDAKCRALGDLAKARQALGLEGGALIHNVLGQHMTLGQCAEARGMSTDREKNYLGRRFRECLDTLAIEFGYATRTRS
jgi:hypothetical protein